MNFRVDHEFLTSGLGALPSTDAEPDSGQDVLALLLDALAHGVLVVSEQGQILHANQSAQRELDSGRVLQAVGGYRGQLWAVRPADGRTLHDALAKAAAGQRNLISLSGESAHFMLAVVPLQREAGAHYARLALFFARAGVCESGMFDFFARSYGLTHTEERVLAILCRGLSTPEIAAQMKVAVSTVRSHVRSLCAKTASSGVRELVNRVAVLPPVASPGLLT